MALAGTLTHDVLYTEGFMFCRGCARQLDVLEWSMPCTGTPRPAGTVTLACAWCDRPVYYPAAAPDLLLLTATGVLCDPCYARQDTARRVIE